MDRKTKRYTTRSLTRYVVFSISSLIIYTITVMIMSCSGVEISDTLTQCFFAFFGGETVTCAIIKSLKLITTYKEIKEQET